MPQDLTHPQVYGVLEGSFRSQDGNNCLYDSTKAVTYYGLQMALIFITRVVRLEAGDKR